MNDQKFPKLNSMKTTQPELLSVLRKMVKPEGMDRQDIMEKKRNSDPNLNLLNKISSITATNIVDAKNIYQLLPDIRLCIELLVSAIISPKDMTTSEVTYSAQSTDLDPSMVNAMVGVIKEYFDEDYKINEQLSGMLESILGFDGSYPVLVLPESTIDDVINSHQRVTMESISTKVFEGGKLPSLGILGNSVKRDKDTGAVNQYLTLESFSDDLGRIATNSVNFDPVVSLPSYRLSVSDNPAILKVPQLYEKIKQDYINDRVNLRSSSMTHEAYGTNITGVFDNAPSSKISQRNPDERNADQIRDSMYVNRNYKTQHVVQLKTVGQLSRPTFGHASILKIPARAVIPCHVPGNPTLRTGYYIMLDANTGHPVSEVVTTDYYNDLASNLTLNRQMVESMQTNNFNNGGGRFTDMEQQKAEIDVMIRNYTVAVERDLLDRLENGVYGKSVEIPRIQEFYRIMFARSLSKKNTQLLYVPEEMMTYFAFDYNEYGVGSSLLDQTKILGAMRILILFANTMAGVSNSVGRVQVNIELDERDPNPSQTVEILMHEYVRNRSAEFPLGASNPSDLVTYLQRAAVDLNVTGNKSFPNTKFGVEDKVTNRAMVDTTLDDNLRNRHINAMGLTPEQVELGQSGVDFATSIVTNNINFTKRIMNYQRPFCNDLTDLARKATINSSIQMDKLRKVAAQYTAKLSDTAKTRLQITADTTTDVIISRLVLDFIRKLELKLPQPNSVTLENQVTAMETYMKALDMGLKALADMEFLTGTTLGDAGSDIGVVIASIRSFYARKFMQDNNMLPELFDMVTKAPGDKLELDVLGQHRDHVELLGRAIEKDIVEIMKTRKARNARLEGAAKALGEELPQADTGGGGGYNNYNGDQGGFSPSSSGDEFGGTDDLDSTESFSTETETTETTDESEEGDSTITPDSPESQSEAPEDGKPE